MTQDAPLAKGRKDATFRRARSTIIPAVAALVALGCSTLGFNPGQPLVPDRVETRTGPFAVYTNTKIAADSTSLRALSSLENDLAAHLALRATTDGPPIEVYILKDRDAFGHFLRFYYPELPPRRAFFLAQGPKRMVYTFTNDRLDEDLRHEGTHALLHLTTGDLPLWLDEGLAEYFEGPDGRDGLNPEHIARLPDDLKAGWKPDLARLEKLANVREMTPRDYRESWAWVHLLLNGPPPGKAALLAYLADLREEPQKANSLASRLRSTDLGNGEVLLSHIEQVRSKPTPANHTAPIAAKPASGGSTVLFQDSVIDPPVAVSKAAPRKSLFGRILSVFSPSIRKDEGK